MAIYPTAVQRLWYPYSPERFITPRLIVLHTNASGGAEDPGTTGTLSWHFQVGQYGTVYQHRDTGCRAAAEYEANDFALSIETWDDGSPDVSCPWTDQQVTALVALISWMRDTHGIPMVVPSTWDGSGLGFHRMFPEWNYPVHSCPGDTRAQQFYDVILPRVQPAAPAPAPQQGKTKMYALVQGDKSTQWWITDYVTKRYVTTTTFAKAAVDEWTMGGIPHVSNGPFPVIWPQARVDEIPTVKVA